MALAEPRAAAAQLRASAVEGSGRGVGVGRFPEPGGGGRPAPLTVGAPRAGARRGAGGGLYVNRSRAQAL